MSPTFGSCCEKNFSDNKKKEEKEFTIDLQIWLRIYLKLKNRGKQYIKTLGTGKSEAFL